MKKTLTNPALENELREGSVFFRSSKEASEDTPATAVAPRVPAAPPAAKPKPASTKPARTEAVPQTRQSEPSTHASSHDAMTSASHDITMSRYHDSFIEDIRKTVKVVGREPGTIRLTETEKSQLADIIYTLGRQGKRTSENELYRIALNYLLTDFKEHGEGSVLSRVITALNA